MKRKFDGTTTLIPLPVVMVSCQRSDEKPNIITLAWTGIANGEPPMLSVSIRKNRHSHGIIASTKEFVVNITNSKLMEATDICGVVSGRDHDKFKLTGLTPQPAHEVKAPLIAECPINLECRTKEVLELGSHDLFVAEIVATHIDESILDEKDGIDVAKLDPVVYCTKAREYWSGLSKRLGAYGFTASRFKA